MTRRRRKQVVARGALSVTCLLAVAACGTAAPSPGTPSPRPTPRGTPTASPTPPPASPSADSQTLSIVNQGMGNYMLATVPVAIVKNNSSGHVAQNVTVNYTILAPNGSTVTTSTQSVSALQPGQTLAIAARVQVDANGDHASATAQAGSWAVASATTSIPPQPATFHCGVCGSGPGMGDVTATLMSPYVATSAPIYLSAVCFGSDGSVNGGGVLDAVWSPTSTTSDPIDLAVIVTGQPASCTAYAVPAF